MNDFIENNSIEPSLLATVAQAVNAADLATDGVASANAVQEIHQEPHPFEALGLCPSLLKAVEGLGYKQPTTVQMRVVPLAMSAASSEGQRVVNDLMVSSQTGSGKTAAFLLPILHRMDVEQREHDRAQSMAWAKQLEEAAVKGDSAPKKPRRKNPTDPRHFKAAQPSALILCPTRELAQQVANDAIDLMRHMSGVRVATVIGGLPYQLQVSKLQNANLVVATPGRLLDLQRNGQIKCEEVKCLVLDEADRMLDLGFSDDLAAIHQLTERREQTMMFSATFAPRIMELAKRVMRDNGKAAQRITIDSPQEKHTNITQKLFWADNLVHKRKLLDHWMRETSIVQAIVFASTQIECDALAQDLADAGFDAAALHGALSQGLRNRRLKMLRDGHIQFLVATDVAARGIDVPSISHVFNYGLPMKAEDYTHRIGRTGRAGRDGVAVTFAEPRDRFRIRDIEDYTHQQLRADVIPGLEPTERTREKKQPFGKFGHKSGGFATKSGGGKSGGYSAGFSGRSSSSRFDGSDPREQRGNSSTGDKWAGKTFKTRAPGTSEGANGFTDQKFPPRDKKSFVKPAGDFKSGAQPFSKTGFKPSGTPFFAKAPRKSASYN